MQDTLVGDSKYSRKSESMVQCNSTYCSYIASAKLFS